MIPGSNVLQTALKVIASYVVQYYQYTGKSTNSLGNDIPTYADPVLIQGSLQPIKKSLYEQYGLLLQKTYYNFYVSKAVLDVERGVSGDKINFMGREFQCESSADWYGVDGWVAIRCVLVQPNA